MTCGARTTDVLVERLSDQAKQPDPIMASRLKDVSLPGVRDTPSWRRLSRGMVVQFRDASVGTIEHIWVDSYHGGIGEIVVRLAAAPHSEVTVPLDRVFLLDDLVAYAAVDAAPIELLPVGNVCAEAV